MTLEEAKARKEGLEALVIALVKGDNEFKAELKARQRAYEKLQEFLENVQR